MVNRWLRWPRKARYVASPSLKILRLLDVPDKATGYAMTDQTSDRDSAADGKKLQLPFLDVLWAVGILGAIFGLTPIIVFYLLTIN
jgi:hypothetical protein